MSNNKQSSVEKMFEEMLGIQQGGIKLTFDENLLLLKKYQEMHNSEMQTKYEDGREIGKIEILTTQSTNNAGAYSDGYKKGYLAALEYMNSTIENKIKLRKYEQ